MRKLYNWLHEEDIVHWSEVIDSEKPLLNQLIEIINKTTRLPQHDLQAFAFASTCLINPVAFDTVPIVWLNGPSGSGKTTLMELANLTIGWKVTDHYIPGSSTPSTRNKLRKRFFTDCDLAKLENREPNILRDGCRLTLDNVWNRSFKDEDFYVLVVSGYREGATWTIASAEEAGENIEFPIYSLKFCASVEDCSEDSRLVEMATRTLMFRTEMLNLLPREDVDAFQIEDQLKISQIDWEGFADQFNNVWDCETAISKEAERLKVAVKKLNRMKMDLTPRQRELTLCAMASAYAFSDMSLNEIAHRWADYWKWTSERARKESLLASLIRRNFLMDEIFAMLEKDSIGLPLDLECKTLQDYFVRLKKEGQVKKEDDLDLAMLELGYVRKEKGKEARWVLRGGDPTMSAPKKVPSPFDIFSV